MISFIVPAHNEEFWIGKCLGSIRTTMGKLNEPCEVIVVDDASTDSTHQIARRLGARIHRLEHRRISAVRNAGARAACGELFFFVDADTQVNERAVSAALAVLRAGATGGGCVFDFNAALPRWARILHFIGVVLGRLIDHWSERRRATSVANANVPRRPRRSVLSLTADLSKVYTSWASSVSIQWNQI